MRILVVEDHEKVAQFIKKGLQEQGYAVDVVTRGDEVLYMTQLNPYDLIVLDVMLPGQDGVSVTRDLRKYGENVPILMLTAKNQVDDRVAGLDAGADDYLTKPFAFMEFLARIRALLRRKGDSSDNVLTLGSLTVDVSTRAVTRGDQAIDLTNKEFSLLEFLLRNKSRVLTRTSIIEHVWDMHFDSDTNLVDVYIRYLRQKIDEGEEQKLIHTVRGAGYVMKEDA
jgi:heavy metal response regulator